MYNDDEKRRIYNNFSNAIVLCGYISLLPNEIYLNNMTTRVLTGANGQSMSV